MPFKSEKQRRYLWREHPDIARKWADKYPQKGKLPMYANKEEREKETETDKKASYVDNCNNMETGNVTANVCEKQKMAGDKLVRVKVPQSEEPTYAGESEEQKSTDIEQEVQEALPLESEENSEKKQEKSKDDIDTGAEEILKKFSAIVSPVLRQKIEDNMAALEGRDSVPVKKNPGIEEYSDSGNLTTQPPVNFSAGASSQQVQQPGNSQQPDPNAPVGGGSHPQHNVIKSFGPLSSTGQLNGNAAFGAKNSPNSSKSSSALEKISMRRVAPNCMCTGVKAYKCNHPKSCQCRKPGMSCSKYVDNDKTASVEEIMTTIQKWASKCSCGCGDTVATCKCGPECSCRKEGGSCYKAMKKESKSPAWQRSEGQNSEGGLNAKGRASYNKATGGNLKAPVTEKNPTGKAKSRRASFCARMGGMKKKLTGKDTASDPDSRINKALRKWNC